MSTSHGRWLVLLATLGVSGSAPAQEVVWHAVGRFNVNWHGDRLTFVGDLDGDGFEEVINMGQQNQQTRSALFVLSGRTGQVLRSLTAPQSGYWYVGLARAGDWDRDGYGDYAIARRDFISFGPSVVEVVSGKDDSMLFSVTGLSGDHLLSDLDTDGDGRPDLIVAVERESAQGGALYVYANSGQLRYRYPIPWGNTNLGKVGDLDHDGCDDFGYLDAAADGVRVVSGRTAVTLLTVRGDLPADHIGLGAITVCGDLDADGTPDFAASGRGSFPNNGVVRVFSGRDGSTLFTFRKAFPPNGSAFNFGEDIASGFDLDQDGIQDLVVGGCQYDCDPVRMMGDRLFVYLLRDGREVEICTPDLQSVQWFTQFGLRVAVGKPHPGSTFPVFACGEGWYGQGAQPLSSLGRVTLFRLPSALLRPEGAACRGTLGQAPRAGVVELGSVGVRMHLSEAPAGASAVLLAGTSNQSWGGVTLPIKLEPWGFVGCELQTAVQVTLPTVTGRLGNRTGYASVDLPLPVSTASPRRMVYAQWLVLGSGAQAPGALSVALGWPF